MKSCSISSSEEDGYIGIYGSDLRYQHTTENGELWAQATLFRGLLAYYESVGDERVLQAVEKAVALTMHHYPINESTPFKVKDALLLGKTNRLLAFKLSLSAFHFLTTTHSISILEVE